VGEVGADGTGEGVEGAGEGAGEGEEGAGEDFVGVAVSKSCCSSLPLRSNNTVCCAA